MMKAVFQGGERVFNWADAVFTQTIMALPYGQVARGYLEMRRGNRGSGAFIFMAGLGGMLFTTGFIGALGLKLRQLRDEVWVRRQYFGPLTLPSLKDSPRKIAIKAARCVDLDETETICRNLFKAVKLEALDKKSIHELARECNDHNENTESIHQLCTDVGRRLSELYKSEIMSDSLFKKIPQELWQGKEVFSYLKQIGPGQWTTGNKGCRWPGAQGSTRCFAVGHFARGWINRVGTNNCRRSYCQPRILPGEYVKIQQITRSV